MVRQLVIFLPYIKAKTASRETAFPHALKALTEAEYEAILTRAGRSGPP
jgi:hypothetical protein